MNEEERNEIVNMKNEIEELQRRIRALENDLDDMSQEIEDANKVRRAVVEIQEFLTKKANGYDVNFHSYLIRLNK
tara:strand:+ start:414 stop:638 length:225 start_codon:yes stop_codon:yes gene_type:complete